MTNIDFIHPLDREMSKKVLNSGLVKGFLETIFNEQLDDINMYIHSASMYRIEEDHPAVQYLCEGCEMFDISDIPPVYVVRTYQYDVIYTGFEKPIIQIPDILLENANMDILRGRMMASAAAIKAEHHKLKFLLWTLQNFGGVIPIPFATTAMRGLLYEWYRAQYYTYDRAFYLSTKNAELSLKNILFGEISSDILENFEFGSIGTYDEQVERFFQSNNLIEGLASVNAFFQHESWLPARYKELKKFCGGI